MKYAYLILAVVGWVLSGWYGPVGGNQHSEEEYLDIESLEERALLLAFTIEALSAKTI
ncbi:hypothetical protein J32TS2_01360 [Shouchella clausii]|uniref:hypothetical protein n=1 Tax=Shouchella clausii TaxID=79880 RepID=UPI001B096A4E|nr:hypothetical protein [Shouchella clausii]GIN14780.1 hypothetical protein J32TS2_01360 [Shouchella clausii]